MQQFKGSMGCKRHCRFDEASLTVLRQVKQPLNTSKKQNTLNVDSSCLRLSRLIANADKNQTQSFPRVPKN